MLLFRFSLWVNNPYKPTGMLIKAQSRLESLLPCVRKTNAWRASWRKLTLEIYKRGLGAIGGLLMHQPALCDTGAWEWGGVWPGNQALLQAFGNTDIKELLPWPPLMWSLRCPWNCRGSESKTLLKRPAKGWENAGHNSLTLHNFLFLPDVTANTILQIKAGSESVC